MRRLFSISLVLTSLRPLYLLGAQQPTAADLVRQLYQTYAWETQDSTATSDKPLFAVEPLAMRAFLDSSFVAAIMADRACQKRTDGICNLDFDPIWASQDPVGATWEVSARLTQPSCGQHCITRASPNPLSLHIGYAPRGPGGASLTWGRRTGQV